MKTSKAEAATSTLQKMCTKINPKGFHKYKAFFLHKQNDVSQTMENNFVEEVCYV